MISNSILSIIVGGLVFFEAWDLYNSVSECDIIAKIFPFAKGADHFFVNYKTPRGTYNSFYVNKAGAYPYTLEDDNGLKLGEKTRETSSSEDNVLNYIKNIQAAPTITKDTEYEDLLKILQDAMKASDKKEDNDKETKESLNGDDTKPIKITKTSEGLKNTPTKEHNKVTNDLTSVLKCTPIEAKFLLIKLISFVLMVPYASKGISFISLCLASLVAVNSQGNIILKERTLYLLMVAGLLAIALTYTSTLSRVYKPFEILNEKDSLLGSRYMRDQPRESGRFVKRTGRRAASVV